MAVRSAALYYHEAAAAAALNSGDAYAGANLPLHLSDHAAQLHALSTHLAYLDGEAHGHADHSGPHGGDSSSGSTRAHTAPTSAYTPLQMDYLQHVAALVADQGACAEHLADVFPGMDESSNSAPNNAGYRELLKLSTGHHAPHHREPSLASGLMFPPRAHLPRAGGAPPPPPWDRFDGPPGPPRPPAMPPQRGAAPPPGRRPGGVAPPPPPFNQNAPHHLQALMHRSMTQPMASPPRERPMAPGSMHGLGPRAPPISLHPNHPLSAYGADAREHDLRAQLAHFQCGPALPGLSHRGGDAHSAPARTSSERVRGFPVLEDGPPALLGREAPPYARFDTAPDALHDAHAGALKLGNNMSYAVDRALSDSLVRSPWGDAPAAPGGAWPAMRGAGAPHMEHDARALSLAMQRAISEHAAQNQAAALGALRGGGGGGHSSGSQLLDASGDDVGECGQQGSSRPTDYFQYF